MRRAILIGASSGIGRALAKVLVREGYVVVIAARRVPLLEELQQELGDRALVKPLDVADVPRAMTELADWIQELGDVDLVVLNAGTGHTNPDLRWDWDDETIRVNVHGIAALGNVAMRYFIQRRSGHLVGISSVAGVRGNSRAVAYCASKAFLSTYLDGLRYRAWRLRLPIAVTDVRPGWVDTAMGQSPQRFWVSSPELAAEQIYSAICRRKRRAYVTRRWILIAWLMRLLPDCLYRRLA
ncbi:MAG: SDR family NAD(P)-dependent oxidoreductase [Planctomycetes bacterium]|nr:SDR family NAD(P)-dependent oxidoreductase [Planctomycetota bacterium]